MAFIDMPRKVRPWKRGLSGLSGVDADNKQRQADALAAQAAALAGRGAQTAQTAAEIVKLQTQAQILYGEAARSRAAEAASASSAANKTVVRGSNQDFDYQRQKQLEEQARRGSSTPAVDLSKVHTVNTSGLVRVPSGNVGMVAAAKVKEDSGSTSFSDVLNSIAEVVGVAAPVADRIVQSEQARRAETVARRAERAAQNALITSGQTPQPSSFPTSTVAYSVGGLVVGGLVLWGLSSLLGGSSTPSVVVAK